MAWVQNSVIWLTLTIQYVRRSYSGRPFNILSFVSGSVMMQEPYIDKTRIGAFGQVNTYCILLLLSVQTDIYTHAYRKYIKDLFQTKHCLLRQHSDWKGIEWAYLLLSQRAFTDQIAVWFVKTVWFTLGHINTTDLVGHICGNVFCSSAVISGYWEPV